MPFRRTPEDGAPDDGLAWEPVTLAGDAEDHQVFHAAGALGTAYACALVEHLRFFSKDCPLLECGERLVEIVEAMIAKGIFGMVEIAFVRALGEFIACGRVQVSLDFEATQAGYLTPADDAEGPPW